MMAAFGRIVNRCPMPVTIVAARSPSFGSVELHETRIVDGVKQGVILRLNSGIYHVVSTYGDANAHVRTDVTVEAGKLTWVVFRP